jgi:hypothetical protein
MESIQGWLEHYNGKFNAKFVIKGYLYSLTGTILKGLPNFETGVKLSYENIKHVEGRGKMKGEMGPKHLFINLPNGVVISGAPETLIDGVVQISGKVTWLLY